MDADAFFSKDQYTEEIGFSDYLFSYVYLVDVNEYGQWQLGHVFMTNKACLQLLLKSQEREVLQLKDNLFHQEMRFAETMMSLNEIGAMFSTQIKVISLSDAIFLSLYNIWHSYSIILETLLFNSFISFSHMFLTSVSFLFN